MKRIHKEYCEICGSTEKNTLHYHHIIGRKEIGTSNDPFNLAVLCASCHALVHAKKIKIIGVYPSTKPPAGRTLIFEKDGKSNCDINEPYCEYKPKQMRLYEESKSTKKESST